VNLSKFQEDLINQLLEISIQEDIFQGDHTSLAVLSNNQWATAQLKVKETTVICGLDIARRVFNRIDSTIKMNVFVEEGQELPKGSIAFTCEGPAISLLSSERLVLNFMQRLSGIASHTRRLTKLIEGSNAVLLDTRKTTPGMRVLEKWAVLTGGGQNHRMGLFDMIMIKDNHIDFAGGIIPAVNRVVEYLDKNKLDLKIEVEARSLNDVKTILTLEKVDRIMCDNFSIVEVKEAVQLIHGKKETEASGGITEETLRDYALAGVDYISVGALTHQINSVDLSLKAIIQ